MKIKGIWEYEIGTLLRAIGLISYFDPPSKRDIAWGNKFQPHRESSWGTPYPSIGKVTLG